MAVLVVPFWVARAMSWDPLLVTRALMGALMAVGGTYLLRSITGDREDSPIRTLIGLLAVSFYIEISRTGMESILLIPLYVMFLERLAAPQGRYGLLGLSVSLVVLARVDSVLFLGLLLPVLLWLERPSLRELLWLALGLLPIPGYLAFNYLVFGIPFPVSGLAKTVRSFSGFHGATFQSLLHPPRFLLGLEMACVLAVLWGLLEWARFGQEVPTRIRAVFGATLAGLILYYLGTSLRSGLAPVVDVLVPFPVHIAGRGASVSQGGCSAWPSGVDQVRVPCSHAPGVLRPGMETAQAL